LAHATQVDPTSKWWFGLDDNELAKVYPWEDWILAMSVLPEIPEGMMETDLFAGVRESDQVTA
jgi:mycothiol S-conjugate amidase